MRPIKRTVSTFRVVSKLNWPIRTLGRIRFHSNSSHRLNLRVPTAAIGGLIEGLYTGASRRLVVVGMPWRTPIPDAGNPVIFVQRRPEKRRGTGDSTLTFIEPTLISVY
jgi:hypothetical protein